MNDMRRPKKTTFVTNAVEEVVADVVSKQNYKPGPPGKWKRKEA